MVSLGARTFNTIGAFVKTVIVKKNALQETWPKGFFTADKTVRNLKTSEIKYFISRALSFYTYIDGVRKNNIIRYFMVAALP